MPRVELPSNPPIPKWVKLVYAVIQWVDRHPIYLLPRRIRDGRHRFYDRYCYCSNCVERRSKGRQEPGYLDKGVSNA